MTRRFVLAALATVLLAPPASAQIGEMKLHDFAAKWMVQQDDFADIGAWREANRILLASADHRPRIVLMGDSITYHWQAKDLPAPAGLNLLNRGVAGQNTTQMLLRFEDDVIALKPAAVVILGGTNDLRAYVGDPAGQADGMIERSAATSPPWPTSPTRVA